MSNAYINQILYAHGHRGVTKEYVDGLLPNMLTSEWLERALTHKDEFAKNAVALLSALRVVASAHARGVRGFSGETPTESLSEKSSAPILSETNDSLLPLRVRESHNVKESIERKITEIKPQMNNRKTSGNHANTLFWAIYSAENPKEAFLRPSAKNVEIETRMQIVDKLKKMPKQLKLTSAKLTLEQTQALFGSMLTAKEDRLDFCVAYSVYYNKHILVVYPKTYRMFSPTLDSTIEDDDHVIILYVSKDRKNVTYSADQSPSKSAAEEIMRTRASELKAQSTYKTPELESIAEKMGVPTRRAEDGKRRKKEDVYNDIRVIIHNDMDFVGAPQAWQKN